jgi:hypothetical protein
VTWVEAQLENSPAASKQVASLVIMFWLCLRGQNNISADGLYNYHISLFKGKYDLTLKFS